MPTSTTRLALSKPNPDPVTGDFVDVSVLNSNFDKLDAAIGLTVCTSSTRPTTPWQGQTITETDTGRAYFWSGSAWVQIAVANARMLTNIEWERALTTDWVISGHVAGDTQKRFIVDAAGKIQFGPGGSTAPDVNLYRSGANQLKTDDALVVAGALTAQAAASVGTTLSVGTDVTVTGKVTVSGAGSSIPCPAPTAPTMVNGWINYGAPFQTAGYWKDASGMVYLCGLIKGGTITSGTTIFTLPAGFRPANAETFAVVSADSTHSHVARCDVNADGTVVTQVGFSASFTSLSGICFRQAN